ncbi:initiator tRNA phosphoribosyl transferase [Laetiporus sulphureus 93-53]|uniref:Initiator tRNA phosphoribosyl transferase n=1 Tax=Laetiporus sulphureus 93-53 TaxID=1314785 RepID=A0A165DQE1_9APHY|nr:initiator tRNA phosphoribosyl transferase [Laetiporus sulphureus 93-53]KZT05396.1 initiator tRNA phosphoribosyl transferase [Laetiporus sulphureus 93-53]
MLSRTLPEALNFRRDQVPVQGALAELRKESLDIYNRLHSISEDIDFVNDICAAYPHLPVLPNQRCGAWYVDPAIAREETAYFKSTDGHFGNWSFNLRRPNLHLLSIIACEGGMILVDSTRAGKKVPDALSKTVPIWCAVINRAVRRKYSSPEKDDWDTQLYCSASAVSAQEQAQIEARLDTWVDSLIDSAYILADLLQPLRPVWVTPSTSVLPDLSPGRNLPFYPIVCVSASQQIHEGLQRRSHGFAYIQGSGDDHESWGMGLNPPLFWENKDELLACDRPGLSALIRPIVARTRAPAQHDGWTVKPSPISHIGGQILVGVVDDLPFPAPRSLPGSSVALAYVLLTHRPWLASPQNGASEDILGLQMLEGKKDQIHFLQNVLPRSMAFIGTCLTKDMQICVCCDTGKDACVGVALAALQLFFDDSGKFAATREQQAALSNTASKQSLQKRLQWIISSRPQANPSRVTLKRVNEYILTSPSFRRQRGVDCST